MEYLSLGGEEGGEEAGARVGLDVVGYDALEELGSVGPMERDEAAGGELCCARGGRCGWEWCLRGGVCAFRLR